MTTLALAAISARVLAEAAAREGFGAVALDLFGDRDTCRAAATWMPIGRPGSLHFDGNALLEALEALARRGDVQGWVAGAGFDGRPDLLAQGAARLPLFGTAAADQRRVRDPATFFGFLKACGFSYPPVRQRLAGDARGWLAKDAGGCGGWHITRAAQGAYGVNAESMAGESAVGSALHYLQREARGVSMSATFIANGRDAVLLGFNEQIVQPLGAKPWVYRGALGPVPVSAAVRREVGAAVRACAETFGLRGLGSLDFLLDGDRVLVLEVNPRPPASLALYPRVGDGGVLRAHLRACRAGQLPRACRAGELPRARHAGESSGACRAGESAGASRAVKQPGVSGAGGTLHTRRDGGLPRAEPAGDLAAGPSTPGLICGSEIVYAPRAVQCDAAAVARLAARPDTHDLPRAAACFAADDPVCSVSASGASAEAVKAELARRRDALLRILEAQR